MLNESFICSPIKDNIVLIKHLSIYILRHKQFPLIPADVAVYNVDHLRSIVKQHIFSIPIWDSENVSVSENSLKAPLKETVFTTKKGLLKIIYLFLNVCHSELQQSLG